MGDKKETGEATIKELERQMKDQLDKLMGQAAAKGRGRDRVLEIIRLITGVASAAGTAVNVAAAAERYNYGGQQVTISVPPSLRSGSETFDQHNSRVSATDSEYISGTAETSEGKELFQLQAPIYEEAEGGAEGGDQSAGSSV